MQDLDPVETQEWLDALESVLDREGEDRAHYLMTRMGELASRSGTQLPYAITTPYRNTIPVTHEARMPGDLFMERRIRPGALERPGDGDAGEQARPGPGRPHLHLRLLGDPLRHRLQLFLPGSHRRTRRRPGVLPGPRVPGVYARAFLEGRISEEQLENFRQEVDGNGLSSYPHPWLMPDFWQFPTVSMGLGPIQAIYQARFMKYLESRGFIPAGKQKVWCFMGDGECDEPESLGAISLAGRETRQPDLRHQLQPAAPRRPGPRQRQDHPGAGRRVPRRRVERQQGHLGSLLGPAVRQGHRRPAAAAHGRGHRRRIPELQGERRRLRARALLRRASELLEMVKDLPTRKSGSSTAAATTPTRSMRPTTRRSTTRASRPSSWPRPSRATAPAAAKRRTSRTT